MDYYGSFLAIKNDFKLNIFDDLEYLVGSDFFIKNKNVLFNVENYDHIMQDLMGPQKLTPLIIGNNVSAKSNISAKSFNDEIFENIFEDNNKTIDLNDLKQMNTDLEDITNSDIIFLLQKRQQLNLHLLVHLELLIHQQKIVYKMKMIILIIMKILTMKI